MGAATITTCSHGGETVTSCGTVTVTQPRPHDVKLAVSNHRDASGIAWRTWRVDCRFGSRALLMA